MKNVELLANIERDFNVVEAFKYKDTSAWIAIKIFLSNSLYDKNIRLNMKKESYIFSKKGIILTYLSIINLLKSFNKKGRKVLFVGASTGFLENENKIVDSYFPYYDVQESSTLYTVNCGNFNQLYEQMIYIKKFDIVVDNLIFSILKKVTAKFFLKNSDHHVINKMIEYLGSYNITVSNADIQKVIAEFVVGYEFYRLYYKQFKFEKAYIVSPSTKSDICAALKSLNVEIIEIQHGVVGKQHRGYNYNFKQNFMLPVPDSINVYNEFWKNEIVNSGFFKSFQIKVVGNFKYNIAQSNFEDLRFKYIIFTGQGAFLEDIANFFKASDHILNENMIKLIYKPHPRELREELDWLKKVTYPLKSFEIYNGKGTTEELIKNSIAHISIFSACHFDAIHYKNKTYVFDIYEENNLNEYILDQPEVFIKIKTIEEVLFNEKF